MKFSEVLGQESAKERLRQMADRDEIPHAILLHGEAGIPKLALARAFAQYIHCQNKINGDSCGVCPSCMQHQSLNHADTFYSYPIAANKCTSDDYSDEWRNFLLENPIVEDYEKWLVHLKNENLQPNIYVGEGTRILHKMSLSAMSTKYKVLIMWLPEKMKTECANKLLKIIEEPTDDSIFVLVSNNQKEVLPTIFSRTQRVELKRLPISEISRYLQSKYQLSMNDANAIAATCEGDVLRAESSLSMESENKEFFNEFVRLMRLAYSRDLKQLKEWSECVFAYKREKIRRFLTYSSRMIRENYIYNIKDPQLNFMTSQEESFSVKFSPFINELNVIKMLDEFNKAEIDIAGNGNGKIILFDLAIKITILIKR